jgi:hypothetical protein
VIIKNLLATAIMLLSAHLAFSPIVLAQTTEESTSIESTEQIEIIDSTDVECILSNDYDALSEEQKVNQELPLCYETEVMTEVSTEELAAETYAESTTLEQSINNYECIPALEYDALTSDERAAIEVPLCYE